MEWRIRGDNLSISYVSQPRDGSYGVGHPKKFSLLHEYLFSKASRHSTNSQACHSPGWPHCAATPVIVRPPSGGRAPDHRHQEWQLGLPIYVICDV